MSLLPQNPAAWRLRERFCVSVRRIDSSLFHCAASASGSECGVPEAQFGRCPCPQAPLALLASHGVTEVKHLRCLWISCKKQKKDRRDACPPIIKFVKFVEFVDKQKKTIPCVSVRRSDSRSFHCAARGSGSECVVPAARFFCSGSPSSARVARFAWGYGSEASPMLLNFLQKNFVFW